jgi:hypothetical protein
MPACNLEEFQRLTIFFLPVTPAPHPPSHPGSLSLLTPCLAPADQIDPRHHCADILSSGCRLLRSEVPTASRGNPDAWALVVSFAFWRLEGVPKVTTARSMEPRRTVASVYDDGNCDLCRSLAEQACSAARLRRCHHSRIHLEPAVGCPQPGAEGGTAIQPEEFGELLCDVVKHGD